MAHRLRHSQSEQWSLAAYEATENDAFREKWRSLRRSQGNLLAFEGFAAGAVAPGELLVEALHHLLANPKATSPLEVLSAVERASAVPQQRSTNTTTEPLQQVEKAVSALRTAIKERDSELASFANALSDALLDLT